MKYPLKLVLTGVIFLAVCSWLNADETEIITHLRDKDWTMRRNAANMLGSLRSKSAVKPLIEVLEDETRAEVSEAVNNALIAITGQKFNAQHEAWIKWWEETGQKQFGSITPAGQQLSEARTYLNITSVVIIISLFLLLLFVMVFSFIGGSKIKAMKELIKRSEKYISDAEGVTGRFDRMIEEIERRRIESADFFRKLKEENTAEIERFSDLSQQNLEHQMREVTMNLREKAEAELKETVLQVKQEIEREAKRLLLEQREIKEKFLNEIEAHTTFVEASFYLLNGRHKEALRLYKKVLALKPDYYNAWNNNGTALRGLGRYEEALESVQKAFRLAPDNPLVLYNLAATYALLKKKNEMLEYLGKAFQLDNGLKDEALNDNAFKGYWTDKAFKDIAE